MRRPTGGIGGPLTKRLPRRDSAMAVSVGGVASIGFAGAGHKSEWARLGSLRYSLSKTTTVRRRKGSNQNSVGPSKSHRLHLAHCVAHQSTKVGELNRLSPFSWTGLNRQPLGELCVAGEDPTVGPGDPSNFG